jgi:adenylylsulfate kinase
MLDKNIVWHNQNITKKDREKLLNQKPILLWFTGLSGSGKSTIANTLEKRLYQLKYKTVLLDGDNIRHGLNNNLGFSDDDRVENIRRVAEVSKLFIDAGIIVITAFISPFIKDREIAKNLLKKNEFIEIFIDTPIDVCKKRDPKGLYKKAIQGEIKDFTGVSSPYETPVKPNINLKTDKLSIDESVEKILEYLKLEGYIC